MVGGSDFNEAIQRKNAGQNSCIFFLQAEDGIRDVAVTGVQTCALPIYQLTSMQM